MNLRRPTFAALTLLVVVAPLACDMFKEKKPPQPEEPPIPIEDAARVPPAVTPLSDFADASLESLDGKTPLEQARTYESRGQLWLARLVLEKRCEADKPSKDECEFLAYVCSQQRDPDCVHKMSGIVGRTLKFDGGAPRVEGAPSTQNEPETDFTKARVLHLKGDGNGARSILEDKVLKGKSTKEEIRLLRLVCEAQSDRMCVALCDAKLK